MIPQTLLHVFVFSCLLGPSLGQLAAAQDAVGNAARPADEASQVDTWTAQLSAPRFADRELATQRLVDAGIPSIEPVVTAVRGDDLEAAERGLHILRQLALDDDEQIEDAARAALEKMASGEVVRLAHRARNTLKYLDSLRQGRAVAKIRKLGGTVDERNTNQFTGAWQVITTYSITIDDSWEGGRAGLKYLRWLDGLQNVTFRGENVQDDWLQALEGLKKVHVVEINRTNVGDSGIQLMRSLPALAQLTVKYSPVSDKAVDDLKQLEAIRSILLFGTNITPEGANRLRTATAEAGVHVDYRRGAFLGVGCQQTEAGCTISQVHPGSAAEKADLRVGDIVTQYAGNPVPDFQTLTTLISESHFEDKAKLQIRRNKKKITKEVELGKWE